MPSIQYVKQAQLQFDVTVCEINLSIYNSKTDYFQKLSLVLEEL